MTLEQLEQFCRDYDACYGRWPENEYEGWALWEYIQGRLKGLGPNAWEWPFEYRQRPGDWPPVKRGVEA